MRGFGILTLSARKAPLQWGIDVMKQLDCPLIGVRPVSEFVYGGAVRPAQLGDPDPDELAVHVFHRDGSPRVLCEWWYHRPTGRWFVLERDTATNEVHKVVPPEEVAYVIPTL